MSMIWFNPYQYVVSTDPYYSSVTLLLHCQGANNGTTFTDSSSYNQTITNAGSIITSTANYKFGNSSLYSTGQTNGGTYYLSMNSSMLMFGSNNFTIEFWINLNTSAPYQRFMGNCPIGTYTTNNWAIGLSTTPAWFIGSAPSGIVSASSLSLNAWHHIAAVRNGSTFTLYIDGTSVGSVTYSVSYDAGSSSPTPVYIGRSGYYSYASGVNNEYFSGYLQDIRFTNGVARYTANFPVPTSPFSP